MKRLFEGTARFEVGKMYYLNGHGFDPIKVVGRSKTGKTIVVNNGEKTFRLKVRMRDLMDGRYYEYVLTDSHLYYGWQKYEASVMACHVVKAQEQIEWENLRPGYNS